MIFDLGEIWAPPKFVREKKTYINEIANFLNSQRCLEVYRNYKYLFLHIV